MPGQKRYIVTALVLCALEIAAYLYRGVFSQLACFFVDSGRAFVFLQLPLGIF